jgi:hypothetical protein
MNIYKNKMRPNIIIGKKKLLIFFALFSISYCLLNYAYGAILDISFSDVFRVAHTEDYLKISSDRLYGLEWWQFLKPFILSIILSLTCLYTKMFRKDYFKESIIALLLFIVGLFLFFFLSKFYTHEREKSQETIHKKLIVGKWHCTDPVFGNVVFVFSDDNTGYRFTDSVKTVQKFEYQIKKNLLSIDLESHKFEFYWIDSSTINTLILRAIPKNSMKDDIYSSKFTRGSPSGTGMPGEGQKR